MIAAKAQTLAATQVVALGELIRSCSKKNGVVRCPSNRATLRFFDSIELRDGRLHSMSLDPIRDELSDDAQWKIATSLQPRMNGKSERPASPQIRVSELLADIPVGVRNEFISNLLFQNGALVSAYTGGLQASCPEPRIARILYTLADPGAPTEKNPRHPGAVPLALCGDGWCDSTICSGDKV